MNLIKRPDEFSEAELNHAFQQEVRKSFANERATQSTRIEQSVKEASEHKGKTHPHLGKCVASIPAREYFRLIQKYGKETVHSADFLQYFNRKFTDLSPNKA